MKVEKHTTDPAELDTRPFEAALRTLLQQITETADQLASAFDAPDPEDARSHLPGHLLRRGASRRSTPTIAEVLLECEAYAAVTAPVALASGDLARVRAEARRLHSLLVQAVTASTRQPHRRAEASARVADISAQSVLDQPQVQADLAHLLQLFSRLASLKERSLPAAVQVGQRRALWGRPFFRSRLLIPGMILATALVVIVFLLATIAFATGTGAISGMHLALGSSVKTPAITATPQPAQTPAPSATQTVPPRGPTPTSSRPTLSVSPLIQPLCPDASFLITLAGGQGPLSWDAASPDPATIGLSLDHQTFHPTVSGTLQPGQSVTVYVRAVQGGNVTGQITVSASGNLPSQTVHYDTSDC